MFDMDLENVFIVVRTTKSFLYAQIIKTRNSQEKNALDGKKNRDVLFLMLIFRIPTSALHETR